MATSSFGIGDVNGKIDALNDQFENKLIFSNVTSWQVIEDSGHNILVLRGNYEGTGNFLQLVANGNSKQITINKSINGTETTLATFQGT